MKAPTWRWPRAAGTGWSRWRPRSATSGAGRWWPPATSPVKATSSGPPPPRAALGKLDVVVANAGFGVSGRLERLTLDDYRRQLETNVFGVLRTVYATLDDLKKSRGRLV